MISHFLYLSNDEKLTKIDFILTTLEHSLRTYLFNNKIKMRFGSI